MICVLDELGHKLQDNTEYKRMPDGNLLCRKVCEQSDTVPLKEAQPGDAILFWISRMGRPQHMGFFTDQGMIHSYFDIGRVVEHPLSNIWLSRIISVHRVRGIDPTPYPKQIVWPEFDGFDPETLKNSDCCGPPRS